MALMATPQSLWIARHFNRRSKSTPVPVGRAHAKSEERVREMGLLRLPMLLLIALSLNGAAMAELPAALDSAHVNGGLARRRPGSEIFHPATGLCVLSRRLIDPLELGPCAASAAWRYTPRRLLTVRGTYYCLQAVGAGQPARLSIICDVEGSQWTMPEYSTGRTRMVTAMADGTDLCLDVGSDGVVITNPCAGGSTAAAMEATAADTQWFELVKESSKD